MCATRRPDIIVPFMDYLRDQSVVAESAPLLVAWLDLLTGMASGEEGASTVFGSLLTDAAGKQNPVSWMRMLAAMREYCIRWACQLCCVVVMLCCAVLCCAVLCCAVLCVLCRVVSGLLSNTSV